MDAFNEPEENYKSGYIKIYRSIKNHWIYEPKRKRTKLEAWYDLLLMARHSPYVELIGYNKIPVGRGQILTSQQQLSSDFRWDRSAIRSFLSSLHEDGMCAIHSTSKYTMITICNYDNYQDCSPTKNQPINIKSTSNQHQINTYNNDKTLKNVKNRGNKLPLTDSEVVFLGIMVEVTGREFKTLDEKTRRQFNELINLKYKRSDFKKAATIALSEMKERNKEQYLTPEFITRPVEFQKYVTMELKQQNYHNGQPMISDN